LHEYASEQFIRRSGLMKAEQLTIPPGYHIVSICAQLLPGTDTAETQHDTPAAARTAPNSREGQPANR
jgi:hypothetical protein